MRNFGLIGYPLTHSFSKKYFAEKFARENISGCNYELYPITAIDEINSLVQEHNLQGLNITIPYKKQVLAYIDELTPTVQALGACNCILYKDGKSIGYNTDVAGFEQTFVPHLQAHHTSALVLGSGGASAAVMFVLEKLNIDFRVVSRSKSDDDRYLTYNDLTPAIMDRFSVIINTTPLGTSPNQHECPPIPYEFISQKHYLYDLVYNPPKTRFLQLGQQRGAVIQNGERMLVIQAEESWKIWNQ